MIHVSVVADNNYIAYCAVLLRSIIANASPQNEYSINIVTDVIADESRALLVSMATKNISINIVDARPFVKNKLDKLPLLNRLTVAAYYRFFLPEIFPDVAKTVYLDIDMIVLKDIAELYNTDVTSHYIAAAHDAVYHRTSDPEQIKYCEYIVGINPRDYVNSGTLVMNLERMRDTNSADKLVQCRIYQYQYQYHDQDAINNIFRGQIHYLPDEWNFAAKFVSKTKLLPAIIHYVGPGKPWNAKRMDIKFAYWWHYAKQTAFWEKLANSKPSTSIHWLIAHGWQYLKYVASFITFNKQERARLNKLLADTTL
ncbi:glycosyltransferase family 8 protein [Deferribacterales bacterium RsTz2092]|nr:universal stress protein A [Deferribacterales bacterium]